MNFISFRRQNRSNIFVWAFRTIESFCLLSEKGPARSSFSHELYPFSLPEMDFENMNKEKREKNRTSAINGGTSDSKNRSSSST